MLALEQRHAERLLQTLHLAADGGLGQEQLLGRLSIFAGGALGTVARYAFSGWIYGRLGSRFPWGTLGVNVTGSFLLGLLLPLVMMMVWLTLSEAGPVAGYDSTTFVSYYLMVILVRRLTGVWIIWDMDREIRLGELSFYLLKPFHPIHHHLARVLAGKPLQIILVGPPVLIAAILLHARYDLSALAIVLSVMAMIGGMRFCAIRLSRIRGNSMFGLPVGPSWTTMNGASLPAPYWAGM